MTRSRILFLSIGSISLVAVLLGLGLAYLQSQSPEARYRVGVQFVQQKQFEEAEQIARELLNHSERDWGFLLQGRIYLAQTRYSKALQELNQIEDRGAIRREGAFVTGEVFIGLNQLTKAADAFAFVLSEDPDYVEAHRHLAVIFYDQGDLAQALDHLAAVARLDPRDYRPHRLMGLIRVSLDQFREAVDAYEACLTRSPPANIATEVRQELAEAYLKLLQYDRAEASIDGLNTIATKEIRAVILKNRNELQSAKSLIREVLTEQPNRATAHRICGEILLANQEPQAAIESYQRAIELDPADYTAQYQLVQALVQAGRNEEAKAQQQRADAVQSDLRKIVDWSAEAMKDPWDPEPRRKLARKWIELKRPDLAQMWQRAAEACQRK